ncbi:cdc42 effector protein 3 isoform X2 [Gallus gallus]|uniref:cdc42 effector protein 3 isoform X2 n=1 Tax=Gallus gallus TaxID=9031 RepID=UPI001F00D861|nr:cdc42 effector protein 3 isoform X2 [Gallus gallus]
MNQPLVKCTGAKQLDFCRDTSADEKLWSLKLGTTCLVVSLQSRLDVVKRSSQVLEVGHLFASWPETCAPSCRVLQRETFTYPEVPCLRRRGLDVQDWYKMMMYHRSH